MASLFRPRKRITPDLMQTIIPRKYIKSGSRHWGAAAIYRMPSMRLTTTANQSPALVFDLSSRLINTLGATTQNSPIDRMRKPDKDTSTGMSILLSGDYVRNIRR